MEEVFHRDIIDLAGRSEQQLKTALGGPLDGDRQAQVFPTLQLATVTYLEATTGPLAGSLALALRKNGFNPQPAPPPYLPAGFDDIPSPYPFPFPWPKPGPPGGELPPWVPKPGPKVNPGSPLSMVSAYKESAPVTIDPEPLSWQVDACRLDRAISALTGNSVKVAVADSGIGMFAAFKGLSLKFRKAMVDGSTVELEELSPADSATGRHGTKAAGVLAAQNSAGTRWGVAPGCHLHVVDILRDKSVFDLLRLLGAMEWFAESGVRIVSISQSSDKKFQSAYDTIFTAARRCGILPIVAAGNGGCNGVGLPGSSRFALSVGSMSGIDTIAGDSGCRRPTLLGGGAVPKVLAPGVCPIVQRFNTPLVTDPPSTSMATPFVAGIAALLLEACPSASVDQLEAALTTSARELSRPTCTCPKVPVVDFEAAYARLQKFGLPCRALD